MKRFALPGAIVVFLLLVFGSTVSAAPVAKRVPLRIDYAETPSKGINVGTFQLTPTGLDAGPLGYDFGKTEYTWRDGPGSVQDGQEVTRATITETLHGKRGDLVLHGIFAVTSAGHEYDVATGPWTIVRGTGSYAGLVGGGRATAVNPPNGQFFIRYEGLVGKG